MAHEDENENENELDDFDTDTGDELDDDVDLTDGGDDDSDLDDDAGDDFDDAGDDRDDAIAEQAQKVYDAAYVKQLRAEAAKTRRQSRAREKQAAEEAAERAREEFARDLFGALGLDEDDEVEPDELIALANRQRDEANTRLRNYEIKDAITDAAREHGADLDLLVPYLRGKGLIDELDPDDEDFSEQVADLVEAVVARNPKLLAEAPAPRRSGGDLSGGSGEKKKKKGPKTIDEIRAERKAHREKIFGSFG